MWGRLSAVVSFGVLGSPGAARADHAADTAGGLWPLASLLVFALGFVLVWAMSTFLERQEKPRTEGEEPRGGKR